MSAGRLTILHSVRGRCNPDSANGVDKTIYYLSREQAAQGHEVHILSQTTKEPIPVPGVTIHKVALWDNPLGVPRQVAEVLESVKPDVVHFHSTNIPSNVGLGRHLQRQGIPYVVTPHGNCARRLLKRRPWLKIPYKILLERPFINRAKFVHAVGDEEEIVDYGITVPIIDVPNGMDPADVPAPPTKNVILEKYPEWQGRKLLIFVGRLDRQQKGLDRLLDVIASLGDEKERAGVLLVGPDWKGSREILEGKVEELGLGDGVRFFGGAFGTEKFDLIQSADCFLHPSRWEGMPFAVIEAIAASQLCFVTAEADPGGWLAKEDAGVVVASDEDAIRDGLRRILAMADDERAEIIGRSMRVLKEHFDWGVISSQICDGYRKYALGGSAEVAG